MYLRLTEEQLHPEQTFSSVRFICRKWNKLNSITHNLLWIPGISIKEPHDLRVQDLQCFSEELKVTNVLVLVKLILNSHWLICI